MTPANKAQSAAERLRDSARELFYHQGIRAVGVDELVQKAGVTKPSLYRAFDSKDGLVAAYLGEFYQTCADHFGRAEEAWPDAPEKQLLHYFEGLAERVASSSYRGCGLTNAILEFPEADHPVRLEALRLKQAMRDWITHRAVQIPSRDPELLADGLVLLMEGTFVASQSFPVPGPAGQVGRLARLMIEAAREQA